MSGQITIQVTSIGTTVYRKAGELHRDGDLPAIERKDGYKEWYKKGELHRDGDLPAIERKDGYKEWYKNGELHREEGPAIVCTRNLPDEYWLNGKFCAKTREEFEIFKLKTVLKEFELDGIL